MRLKSEKMSASKRMSALLLAAGATLVLGAGPAFADAVQLNYSVNHSKYGNIGTFANTVDTEGQDATVTTNLNIQVKFLGIPAYRQKAQRVEKWQGDRLVFLHSVTDTNGKSVAVDGVAKGGQFQVTTPSGTAMAPANVRVANPWSPKLMNGDMILGADDGTLSRMQITPGQTTMIATSNAGMSSGQTVAANGWIPVKEYTIDLTGAGEHYDVWFDNSGTPVKFDKVDKNGTVTFTLNSKTPVAPLIASAEAHNASIAMAQPQQTPPAEIIPGPDETP